MRFDDFMLLGWLLAGAQATVLTAESVPTRESELEARIRQLETDSQALQQQAAAALAAAQAVRAELEAMRREQREATVSVAASASASSPNAFNPAISIVLNGVYTHHSLHPNAYDRSGFPLVGEAGPGAQGLSLGESEIALAANIDDRFYGQLSLAAESEDGDDEVGIEEAYVETLALAAGWTLRAGRFFSNIGYLNSHHLHTDQFADRPLAYQAFLGGQYGDDGLQLRWVAPTPFYLELGGEMLRGQSFPSAGAAHAGVGAKSLFAHAGGDVGMEHAWLAGLSALRTRSEGADDGFSGDARIYLADFTWKWAPRGNFKDAGLALRSELVFDQRDGSVTFPAGDGPTVPWEGHRHGAYLEGVFRINRRWDTGYRIDRLWATDSGPYRSSHDPLRHSVILSWFNSEFSLLRLQYSHDRPNREQRDNALFLQYQMNLGAHGAHKF